MTKLKVPSMSCGHCKMTVSKALTSIDGVSRVDIDLETKDVSVTHDPKVSLAELTRAVEDAGYPVA